MNFDLTKQSFQCPYCNERISVMLDPSEKRQQYIEDCEVCCNPIEITCEFNEGKLVYFNAAIAE
jgi:transcription elongation factor Elf1